MTPDRLRQLADALEAIGGDLVRLDTTQTPGLTTVEVQGPGYLRLAITDTPDPVHRLTQLQAVMEEPKR